MGQQAGPSDPRAAGATAGYPPPQGYPPQGYQGFGPPPQGYPPPQGQGYQAYGPPPQGYGYAAPPPPGAPYGAAPYGATPYGAAPPAPHLPARPQQAPKPPQGFDRYDLEAQQAAAAAGAWADQQIRKQFVRKVFSIVFLQLCVTVGVACVFIFVDPVRNYVRPGGPGQWVFIVAWVVSLVFLIALMCSTSLRRKHPWNILALIAFTVVESVLVGCICSYWDVGVVLEAFAVTCAAVGGLTLMAIFGKFDVTRKGHVLAMASGVVFMVLLVTIIVGFFYVNKWWYLAVSVVVALLFSAYLVYDIQLVMGKGAVAIGPDEYIFASVQIYMDVIIIFLQILNIMGIAQS
ncbi:hypothetical protein ABPG77_003939 [Micractinium sp. CCAP 211/92]